MGATALPVHSGIFPFDYFGRGEKQRDPTYAMLLHDRGIPLPNKGTVARMGMVILKLTDIMPHVRTLHVASTKHQTLGGGGGVIGVYLAVTEKMAQLS